MGLCQVRVWLQAILVSLEVHSIYFALKHCLCTLLRADNIAADNRNGLSLRAVIDVAPHAQGEHSHEIW